jgi:hypothetical protein
MAGAMWWFGNSTGNLISTRSSRLAVATQIGVPSESA